MAETQPGGIYRVVTGDSEKFVDAEGKEVKPQSKAAPSDGGEKKQTGETYPYADLLAAGGFNDWQAVQKASDESLDAVEGIGPGRIAEIRAYKG